MVSFPRRDKRKHSYPLILLRMFIHPAFLLVACGVLLMVPRWFLKSLSSRDESRVMFLRQATKMSVNETLPSKEHTEKPQAKSNVEDDYDDDSAAVQKEEQRRNVLVKRPHRWHTFNFGDLHAYFSCTLEFGKGRPLYNSTQWRQLHEYYDHFVSEDANDEGDVKTGQLKRTFRFSDEMFDPPFEGFMTESKGRGIRAIRDIASGEVVNKNSNKTVVFSNGNTYRKFLFGIYDRSSQFDAGTACDVLRWSWVQRFGNTSATVIIASLDEAALANTDPNANLYCSTGQEDTATRDIAKGEELTCSYGDFADASGWSKLGL